MFFKLLMLRVSLPAKTIFSLSPLFLVAGEPTNLSDFLATPTNYHDQGKIEAVSLYFPEKLQQGNSPSSQQLSSLSNIKNDSYDDSHDDDDYDDDDDDDDYHDYDD